jgi:flagellar biosynthesis/type III secretory pathway protein FliH
LPSALAERDADVCRAVFPTFSAVPVAEVDVAPAPGSAPHSAEAEAEERQRAALAAARADGEQEGRAAVFNEWSERLGAVSAALEAAERELAAHRAAVAAEVAHETARLVMLLAGKVMHRELDLAATGSDAVIRVVAQRLAGAEAAVAVRLDPASAGAFDAWRRETSAATAVRVEADPGLARGDWVIETRDGFLDGRLASQLEEAWRLIEESGV